MAEKSKTQQALSLLDKGKTVREVARIVDLSESAVRFADKKRRASAAGLCPTCGAKRKT